MKKKFIPAISIGIAVLVFGSIVYAADRKKNAKTADLPGDTIREEEALKAELLDVVERQEKKPQSFGDGKKVASIMRDDNRDISLLAEVMNK